MIQPSRSIEEVLTCVIDISQRAQEGVEVNLRERFESRRTRRSNRRQPAANQIIRDSSTDDIGVNTASLANLLLSDD